jgi:hypothetical protein
MRMSRILSVPAILLLVVVIASPAKTADFPYPKVGYSADLKMDMGEGPDGRRMIFPGKVYFSGDKERRETVGFGHESIIIWRRDKGVSWILIPDRKMYMEQRGGTEKEDPERMMREGNVKLTKLGSERVNGMATTKYKIEGVDEKDRPLEGFLWATNDDVPVRMEGTSQGKRVRIDYTNIKIGKQDPRLFEIPAGYERAAMPGMPGGPPSGVQPRGQMPQMPQNRPPGMTKDQWEQMKKMMEQMQKEQGGGK